MFKKCNVFFYYKHKETLHLLMNNRVYKYHYFYRITNKKTGQFYFGIHSTNNLNDNYMGSGTFLKKEYRLWGKDMFYKEILKFFETREDLIKYEQAIVNEDVLNNPLCLNIIKGGLAGLGTGFTVGLVTVKDSSGNYFDVKTNDPRYISGELVSVNKNMVSVRDVFGNTFKVHVNDPRYIAGELTIVSKGNKGGLGRTHVVKDGECKFILKEELQQYLDDGWEHKSKCRGRVSPTKGMIWICKEDERKIIRKEDLQQYLDDGWVRTRNVRPLLGTICVLKNDVEKYIQKEELQQYLDDGWIKKGKSRNKGKVTVFDPITKSYIQVEKTNPRYVSGELKTKLQILNTNAKNTKYINKDGQVKRVKIDKLTEYLDNGWELGMNPKNKEKS